MYVDPQVTKRARDSNQPETQTSTSKRIKQTPQSHIRLPGRKCEGVVQRLEQERQLLLETLEKFEERTKKEMGRIRDAWKEKLDIEKLRSSELQKRICQLELNSAEFEEEKKAVSEAKAILTQNLDELSRLQKETAESKIEIASLKETLENVQRENDAWRASARDFCGEDDLEKPIDPATLQLSLFECRNACQEAIKDKELVTSRNQELTKKVKEVASRLRISERDQKRLSFELRNSETEFEKAKLEIAKLNSQIEVLKRCLKQKGSSAEEIEIPKPESPNQELIMKLNQQLVECVSEINRLGNELQCAESDRKELSDRHDTERELEMKIRKLADSRNCLLTQQQQLHSKLAIAIKAAQQLPEEVDLDLRQANARLVKERDGATRRLDSLKIEAKCKRELLLLILEKSLGWKIELAEGMRKEKVSILVASVYSPDEDPGSIKFTTTIAELLPFIKSRETRALLQATLDNSVATKEQSPPPSTPIVSTRTATEPSIEMAFIGRYRDRWIKDKRWKEQLSARKPFPTFAAFLCLEEHALRQRRHGWKQPPKDSPAACRLRGETETPQ